MCIRDRYACRGGERHCTQRLPQALSRLRDRRRARVDLEEASHHVLGDRKVRIVVAAQADEARAFVRLGPPQRGFEVLDALDVVAVAPEALADEVPANLALTGAEGPAVQGELVGLLHRP